MTIEDIYQQFEKYIESFPSQLNKEQFSEKIITILSKIQDVKKVYEQIKQIEELREREVKGHNQNVVKIIADTYMIKTYPNVHGITIGKMNNLLKLLRISIATRRA